MVALEEEEGAGHSWDHMNEKGVPTYQPSVISFP